MSGHKDVVGLLVANGADLNAREEGEDKWNPLTCASRYGFKEIAEILIDNGADVNAREVDSMTPLICAIKYG